MSRLQLRLSNSLLAFKSINTDCTMAVLLRFYDLLVK